MNSGRFGYPSDVVELFKTDQYKCSRCSSESIICGCFGYAQEQKAVEKACRNFTRTSYKPFKNPKKGELLVSFKGNEMVFSRFEIVRENSFSRLVAVECDELDQLIYRSLAQRCSIALKP